MPRLPGQTVHFLLHVPKCAGTTVEEHFAQTLGERFLLAPRWEHILRGVIGNRYPYGQDASRLEGVRAVSGHSLSRSLARHFPQAEIRESVLLRDPVGFHLSLYNYRWTRHWQGLAPEPPEFAEWYGLQRRNPIARFLLTRYFEQGIPAVYRLSSAGRLAWLEARLERFWFVGGLHRTGELIAAVARDLGVAEEAADRNVTETKKLTPESLGAEWCARIAADHALDATLHARWKDRGFEGAPTEPPPPLHGRDHARYVLGDLAGGASKTFRR